jgi:hypothetical protein
MRMLSNSLAPAKASNAKGKSIFEVDNVQNAMETLTEHIEKNFNNDPTLLKFLRTSMRQAMARDKRRLAKKFRRQGSLGES